MTYNIKKQSSKIKFHNDIEVTLFDYKLLNAINLLNQKYKKSVVGYVRTEEQATVKRKR